MSLAKPSRNRFARRFTIAFCGLLLVLVGYRYVLIPLHRKARVLDVQTACSANMRAIGQALDAYARRYGRLPANNADWESLLLAEGQISQNQLVCPVRTGEGFHYHYVEPAAEEWGQAIQTPVLYEALEAHWGMNANVLFANSHVRSVKPDKYAVTIGTPIP